MHDSVPALALRGLCQRGEVPWGAGDAAKSSRGADGEGRNEWPFMQGVYGSPLPQAWCKQQPRRSILVLALGQTSLVGDGSVARGGNARAGCL